MLVFLGIPGIGDLTQTLQQDRQHRPENFHLFTDRIGAGGSFFLHVLVRRRPIGLAGGGRQMEPLGLLALPQFPLRLLALLPLLLDRFPTRTAAALAHSSTLPCKRPPHSCSRKSS